MKKLVCLLMCLLLVGCGSSPDVGLYEAASGIPAEEILLTVDGREVPACRYLYWLTWNCDYLADCGALADGWGKTADGTPLTEYAREQALQTTVLYATVENWAETYGCALSADDRRDMDAGWQRLCDGEGGEEACLDALAWMGLDRPGADGLSAAHYLYEQLRGKACTPGEALWPGEETLTAYAGENGLMSVDALFVSAEKYADPAERKERAEMILTRLEESSDPAAYFSTLAGAYSDDPARDAHPEGGTCAAGDGTLPDALEAAALAMEEGTWSGLLESGAGYYILLRRPTDLQAAAARYFDDRLLAAAAAAEVDRSDAYGMLDVARFREKTEEYREELTRSESVFSAAGAGKSAA